MTGKSTYTSHEEECPGTDDCVYCGQSLPEHFENHSYPYYGYCSSHCAALFLVGESRGRVLSDLDFDLLSRAVNELSRDLRQGGSRGG